jgi:hypothetical protein
LLLQALFLSVWERNKRTVLFVTHDLHEAIFLSDIVVVFTNRPGGVKSIIPGELTRPRPPPAELAIAPEFRDIYSRIWSDLKDEVRGLVNRGRLAVGSMPALPPKRTFIASQRISAMGQERRYDGSHSVP